MFFVLLILKNFLINSTKHVFFVFENKNYFPKEFSKTATKQALKLQAQT